MRTPVAISLIIWYICIAQLKRATIAILSVELLISRGTAKHGLSCSGGQVYEMRCVTSTVNHKVGYKHFTNFPNTET